MPISLNNLRSPLKAWSATVTIAGQPYTVVNKLPSRSQGFDQPRSVCSLEVLEFPGDVAAGAAASVTISLNGEDELFFVGQVDNRPLGDLPLSYALHLVDVLSRLNKGTTAAFTWTDTPFTTAVRQLLNDAGISNAEIAGIANPGADYQLGPNYPIALPVGTSVSETLQRLMEFAGTAIRTDPDGRIRVVTDPTFPANSSPYLYAYGASGSEFGYISSRRTLGGSDGRVARFTAAGPRRPDRQIPDATFTLAGQTGRTERQDYPYCQTTSCAQAIARREIVRRNRAATEVLIEAPLNPLLRPGETILFRNADLGFPIAVPAIVLGVTSNEDVMTMKVSVGQRPPEGDMTFVPPPVADFSYTVERQPVELAGQLDLAVVVSCVAQASDPSGLDITSLQWQAQCNGTVRPSSASWSPGGDATGRTPVFVFDTLEGALVTLSVESESGEGAIVQKAIAPAEAAIFTRKLSAATANGWRVLATETGWRSFGSNCTAVPNINDLGPFLAGFSGGEIYLTEDDLATPPQLLATLNGSVASLYVDEADGLTVTAAHGSTVSQSVDGGVSWVPLHVFADTVRYAAHDAGNAAGIRACAGNALHISLDGGTTWAVSLQGSPGSTARQFARASWGTACVFSGGSSLPEAIMFEGGGTVDWSGVSNPPVFGLTAIAPLLNEPGWLVGSGGVNDVTRDGLMDTLGYAAASGEGQVFKLVQAAGGWRASAAAPVASGGTYKVANYAATYKIDAPGTSYRIGYGGTSEPPLPPELVFLPRNGNLIYHFVGSGWQPLPLPEGVDNWSGVIVNPVNQSQWIAWNARRCYYSATNGASWVEMTQAQGNDALGVFAVRSTILDIAFTGRGSQWVTARSISGASSSRPVGYLARGNGPRLLSYQAWGLMGNQTTPPIVATEPLIRFGRLMTGYSGEVVLTGTRIENEIGNNPPPPDTWWTLPSGSIAPANDLTPLYWLPGDTFTATDRQVLAIEGQNIGYSNNYRTIVPQPVIAAGGSVVKIERGIFCGNREGVAEIRNFSTVPSLHVVAAAGREVGRIVRGARRRAAAVAVPGPSVQVAQIAFFNGEQWGLIDTPIDTNDFALALVER